MYLAAHPYYSNACFASSLWYPLLHNHPPRSPGTASKAVPLQRSAGYKRHSVEASGMHWDPYNTLPTVEQMDADYATTRLPARCGRWASRRWSPSHGRVCCRRHIHLGMILVHLEHDGIVGDSQKAMHAFGKDKCLAG